MAERRWVLAPLSLMVLLQTAAADVSPSVTVRVGDDVILPCESRMKHMNMCDNTVWVYVGPGGAAAVEIVDLGKIKQIRSGSDRLSLTQNCSLDLKNVTVDDVGHYTCRQFPHESAPQQGEDANVDLSVVTMDEHTDCGEVTISCSVSTYRECKHTVMWLFADKDMNEYIRDLKTSQPDCSANVSFTSSYFNHSDRKFKLFQCQVKNDHSGKVELFTFRHQMDSLDSCEPTSWLWFIIVCVGLTALRMAAVTVNIWTRTKGSRNQTDAHG